MKNLEHVSSPSIMFFIFFPTNFAQKFKKSIFFFLFSYISLATKPIKSVRFTNTKTCPQIYKTQKHSTIYCHFFTFPLQTQRPSRIQNTFNKPKVLTHLNPNLQTQANPNSKNPKLKIAFLFLTNSDLHFAPLWQQFFQNAPSKNLYNVYVHANPSINVTCPKGTIFKFYFILAKKTYHGSPTLISITRRLLAIAVIDDPANAIFFFFFLYWISLEFESG